MPLEARQMHERDRLAMILGSLFFLGVEQNEASSLSLSLRKSEIPDHLRDCGIRRDLAAVISAGTK